MTLPTDSESTLTVKTESFTIAPLTENVGLGTTNPAALAAIGGFSGNLKIIDPSNMGNVTQNDMAYISCDPNSDTSNIDPTSVAEVTAEANPLAMILYSLTANSCNMTGDIYSTLYTMTSIRESRLLEAMIQDVDPQGTIGVNSTSSDGTTQGSDTNPTGSAPTTAVAMSILYSITGIITLLFLIIIATGAVRAHRHPERYGPRGGGLPGRPRQSRAKGLARAMLETIPIVKFGDPEPVKAAGQERDIEMESVENNTHPSATPAVTAPPIAAAKDSLPKPTTPPPTSPLESGIGAATKADSTHSVGADMSEENPGCSICTEDFTTGEDVRVLPCNHKYHPACIDPWLLNVSGTCPLCRHDLRPATSNPETLAEGELPPPLNIVEGSRESDNASVPQQRRTRRFMDLHRLRHAPAHERIAALRNLREETRNGNGSGSGSSSSNEDAEEAAGRTTLTSRLRDTFRIRTRPQLQPASEQTQ